MRSALLFPLPHSEIRLPHSNFPLPHSNFRLLQDSFQQRLHLAQDLVVLVPIQLNGFGRTLGTTDAAAVAQGLIDFADTVFIDLGYIVRTGADANQTAGTFIGLHAGGHRRQRQLGLGQKCDGPGRGGVSAGGQAAA